MRKKENYIYIFTFIFFIYLPFLLINHDANVVSVLANKKLAVKPKLILEGKINKDFISEYEIYIDDNIGFKQEAIEWNILIMKSIFNVLDIKDYFIGEDDNIFFTNNGYGYGVWQGIEPYNDYQKESFYESLARVTLKLDELGAKCIFMGIPDKENIYPEYYNKEINRYNVDTPLDDLLKYLEDKEGVNVLNVKDDLLAKKEVAGEYLYYRNYDCTHWNAKGMFVGYTSLVNKIREFDKDIDMVLEEDLNWSKKTSKNMSYLSESKLLNKYITFYDNIWDYTFKEGAHSVDTKSLPDGVELSENSIYYHYENYDIDNSYMYLYMLRLLGESFQDVFFLQGGTPEQLYNLIKATEVIIENVERAFYYWPLLGYLEEVYKVCD